MLPGRGRDPGLALRHAGRLVDRRPPGFVPGDPSSRRSAARRPDLVADADPTRRQVVELVEVDAAAEDVLFSDTLLDGELQLRDGDPPLPLLRVRWRREDALQAAFCLSRRDVDLGLLRDLSRARGNLVPADHGLTTAETHVLPAPAGAPAPPPRPRPAHACRRRAAGGKLEVLFAGGDTDDWHVVPDLLDSPPSAQEFVAEPGDDGRAVLRFGDGEYGRSIAGATEVTATYRVGNGRAGTSARRRSPTSRRPLGPPRAGSGLCGTRFSPPAAPTPSRSSRCAGARRRLSARSSCSAVTAADWEAAAGEPRRPGRGCALPRPGAGTRS